MEELLAPRGEGRIRVRRSVAEKRRIVELTFAPGARVAQAAGVNANQVFRWRREYGRNGQMISDKHVAALLPVVLTARDAGSGEPAQVVELCTGTKIWIAAGVTDMRRGFQGLSAQVQTVLQDVSLPEEVRIGASLQKANVQMRNQAAQERARLERELITLHSHLDAAYTDKLDGKITAEFWQRKQSDWQAEEERIKSLIAGLEEGKSNVRLLTMQRILELAQKAYFLYITREPAEQAELLRSVLLNCSIDAISLYPTYRKPFDLIAKRAKCKEWSGREDLNLRPPGPEPGALPG